MDRSFNDQTQRPFIQVITVEGQSKSYLWLLLLPLGANVRFLNQTWTITCEMFDILQQVLI